VGDCLDPINQIDTRPDHMKGWLAPTHVFMSDETRADPCSASKPSEPKRGELKSPLAFADYRPR
jgi:hypothetical protein